LRQRTHYALGLTGACAAVLSWSSAFVGIRFAVREIPPGPLVLLRFTVASACFVALVAAGRVRWPDKADMWPLLLISFLGQAVYQLALCTAQTRVTAGAAGVLLVFVPVLTALLAIPVLGEKLSARGWIGTFVALAGAVLISFAASGPTRFEPLALLGLVAAAASAGYFVLQKPWLKKYRAIDLAAYGVWTGMAATLVFASHVPEALGAASTSTLLTVLYLGIVPTAVGYSLWAFALANASANKVASFMYLEPIATFILAWLLLGETPTQIAILGAGFALIGVILVNSA
jgi:drug/metabolite transporter (DMT)-like permease